MNRTKQRLPSSASARRRSPSPQLGTFRHLVDLAVDEAVGGAHICYPVDATTGISLWSRPVSTTALRLARRLLGRRRLNDRVPGGVFRHAVLAVTASRVMVWEARFGGRGPELICEIVSWPHQSLTLARRRHEIVSTTDRTKMLRYRIGTPDGQLLLDVPAGRGPAAELDRALTGAVTAEAS